MFHVFVKQSIECEKHCKNFLIYIFTFPDRPHDRVPLKEMKSDWHSCLDNKVGFKVSKYSFLLNTIESHRDI